MIYSVTTYLKKVIKNYLQAFLSDSYILNEEILTDFPQDVRNSFIQTFCTDKDHKGVHIPVRFTFNATKNNPYATILIQQKSGKELVNQDQAIGYDMGSTNGEGDNAHREYSHLHYDPKRKLGYYLVKYEPNHVSGITDYEGHIKIRGNRIYLLSKIPARIAEANDNPVEKAQIFYTSATNIPHDKRRSYPIFGYDASESFTIDLITSNVDTLRCLCAVLKAIFITMRLETSKENYSYYLPKITEAGMDLLNNINNPTDSTAYNQLFYKRFTLNYLITYSLPTKFGRLVDKLIPNAKYVGHDFRSQYGKIDGNHRER